MHMQAPDCFAYEDLLLFTDLKAAETEKKERKEKEVKLEDTIEIKLKKEKPKEEAKPQKLKGNYT